MNDTPLPSIVICVNRRLHAGNPSCAASGSEEIADLLEQRLADEGMAVSVERIYCFGQCDKGPNLRIAPGGRFFHHVTVDDIPALIEALRTF